MNDRIFLTEAFRTKHPPGTRIRHPLHGAATIRVVTESHIEVDWDSPLARIEQDRIIPAAEVPYMSRIVEARTSSVVRNGKLKESVNNKTLKFNEALKGSKS